MELEIEKTASSGISARVCRLCLSSRGEILPIFESGSRSDSDSPPLASIIKACVSVEITEDDRLPSYVCRKCHNNVNNWRTFKKVCADSQAKLQDWLKDDCGDFEKIAKIKTEPFLDENNYNEDVTIDGRYESNRFRNGTEKILPEGPPILASLGLAPRSEKTNVDPRLDWNRVEAIRGLIEVDEPIEGSEFGSGIDNMEESEHDSDTEADTFSCDEDFHDTKTTYVGRDGTIWKKKHHTYNERQPKRKALSGCAGEAKEAIKPEQAWSCLISDQMIDRIVECTNVFISEKFPDAEMLEDVMENTTSRIEIKALFGILYLCGIMRPSFMQHAELWWEDGCGLSAVQNCMTVERFRFLLSCLKFEQNDKVDSSDELSSIRATVQNFIANCKSSYGIESAVVDEIVIPFSGGPCAFRKKMRNKALSTGIKVIVLADSGSFYTSNFEVCSENNINMDKNVSVKKLVDHISGSNMTVVADKWYTSLELARNLLAEHSIYFVGALDVSKPEVSPAFGDKKRLGPSVMYGYLDDHISIASYIGTNRKITTVLSTKPEHCKKNYNDRVLPDSVNMYKQQKSTVEVISVLTNLYTTAQNTDVWQLTLLFFMLDIAGINSQVIWLANKNDQNSVQRRSFLRSLALGLMDEQLKANGKNDSFNILDPLLSVRRKSNMQDMNVATPAGRTRRCKICVVEFKRRDRKTRYHCLSCKYPVCREHMAIVCKYCAPKL